MMVGFMPDFFPGMDSNHALDKPHDGYAGPNRAFPFAPFASFARQCLEFLVPVGGGKRGS